MKPINNFHGYVVIQRGEEEKPDGVSQVIGRPRGPWLSDDPVMVYSSLDELIASIPDFDRKKHIIGEVHITLTGERVEKLTW